MTFADKAYQGARGSIRTPFKRHRYRPKLTAWQKKVNRAHARIRAIGERANATLKTWKILTRLRCRLDGNVRDAAPLPHAEHCLNAQQPTAFQQVWNPADPPPAITVHVVAGLAPGFLVEIDAVAVV
ncbi:DDE Tnp4 domain-containing protein OS=Streptomyces aurantiogriseus OX=66870 GN=GCM10010251_97250 PE=4 SV=1 [Streptomyces aurantiogriseus]|uniref:DDE Tnp4 domain-containing protein n=1 Tax=Streptomyces aurantiogriseus TaxID=66870 RepID=A0A918FPX5_9ACTN|nr:hypothetical protein GCM10010251_97250 [Streptomyces aurantiogriseus]